MQQSSSIYQLSSCDSQTLIHNLKVSMNAAPDKFLLSCRWDFFLCGEATQPKADEHNRWFLKPHSDISEITVRLEIMDKPAKHWQRLKIFVFIVSGLKVILFFLFQETPRSGSGRHKRWDLFYCPDTGSLSASASVVLCQETEQRSGWETAVWVINYEDRLPLK